MSRPATTSDLSVDAAYSIPIQHRRAQVGEQRQMLAQPEDGLLRPQRSRPSLRENAKVSGFQVSFYPSQVTAKQTQRD